MNTLLKWVFIFILISNAVVAQNLVPNPSFENSKFEHYPTPSALKNWRFLKAGWVCDKNINERTSTDIQACLCPKDTFAIDGAKMIQLGYQAGCICSSDRYSDACAQYAITKLSSPLQIGQTYKISLQVFWPKLDYIDPSLFKHLGLMTSYSEPIYEKGSILRKKVLHSSTIKSNQWNQLEWYIEPTCIQNYLTIGIFKNADWDSLKWQDNAPQNGHYFVDKVSVEKVDYTPQITSKFCNEYPYGTVSPSFTLQETTILFDKSSDNFKQTEQQKINTIFKNKNNYKKCVLIEGHADSDGNDNLALSKNRALQIAKYCQDSLNFKPYQLLSIGYSSNKPKSKGASESEKALNRRVELKTINLPPQAMFYRYAHALYKQNKIDSVFLMLNLWENTVEQNDKILVYFDPEFKTLHSHPKWRQLSNKIKKSYKSKSKFDQEAFLLDSLYCTDQMYRLQPNLSGFILDLSGYVAEIDTVDWNFIDADNRMQINDSLNLIVLEKQILAKMGLPKRSQVGGRTAKAALLVLVHCGRLSLMEKYLPIVEQYVLQGEANNELFAILYDKIQIYKNKKQKYGTQFNIQNIRMPTEDEDNLKARRKSIGLD